MNKDENFIIEQFNSFQFPFLGKRVPAQLLIDVKEKTQEMKSKLLDYEEYLEGFSK